MALKTKVKAVMGLGLVAGLGACVLPLASYADTDTDSAQVTVSVAESITITEIGNDALNLDLNGGVISEGDVVSGTHTVKVSTSAPGGYTLSMSATNNSLRKDVGGDVYTGTTGFDPIGGTVTAVTPGSGLQLASGAGAIAFPTDAPVSATGTWGFRLADATWNTGKYAAVPTSPTIIMATDTPSNGETVITFGVQAGTMTPAGKYGTTITYLATSR